MADEVIVLRIQADDQGGQRELHEMIALLERLETQSRQSGRISETAERERQSALRRSETELRRADRAQGQMSTGSRRLGRETSTLSGHLRSAAKYAAGAAAAYIGISQVRSAIDATTEFGKATISLTNNLGLSARAASNFSAVAIARGADSRSLTMAFTTLSGKVAQARAGVSSATDAFKQLGISQQQVQKDSPEQMLARVSDGLQGLGKGFERTAALRSLFGRGAQTLGPILRGGSAEMEAQMKKAQDLGATFSELGLHNVKDVIASERELKLAQLGLQVSFTQAVQPAIEAATGELVKFSQILNDPNMSGDEKLNAISAEFERLFTQLVEQSTKRAPEVAGAFVKGFVEAPVWGQLIAGGLIFARFGGLGSLSKLFGKEGSKAGRTFGLAFLAAGLGLELGKTLADAWNGEMLDQTKSEELSKQLGDALGSAAQSISIGRKGVTVATKLGDLIFNPETGRVVSASTKKLKDLIGKDLEQVNFALTNTFGKGKGNAIQSDWGRALEQLGTLTHSKLGKVLGFTKADLLHIRQAVSQGTDWRDAVKGNLDAYIAQLQRAMDSGKTSVVKGQREINKALQEEAAILGTGVVISAHAAPKSQKGNAPVSGKGMGKQQGGMVVPGYGSGDTVPLHIGGQLAAFVESGELVSVANRTLTSALMTANSMIPRRAHGGTIPTYAPGDSGALSGIAAAADNLMSAAAKRALAKAQKSSAAAGGGPNAPGGPAGTSVWKGVRMATWVKLALAYAAQKGIAPQPTSGYRSHAENVAAGRLYHSEHENTRYPGGAVDFGGMVDPPALPKKMAVVNATRGFRYPLLAPAGFRDDGHASGTGHMHGGIVGLAGGGVFGQALQNYQALWKMVKSRFGGGKAPDLVPVGAGSGYTYTMQGPDGGPLRKLFGNPKYIEGLAGMDPTRGGGVRNATLHEWTFETSPWSLGEGGANRKVNKLTPWLNKQYGKMSGGILRFASGGTVPQPKHGAHWIKDLGSHIDPNEAATLLWQAGLSEQDAGILSRVVPNESGGNPRAHNASGATGLFQILGAVVPGNLYDPRINALNAAKKYLDAGHSLGPWEGAPSGAAGHILRDRVGGDAAGGGAGGLGDKPQLGTKPIPSKREDSLSKKLTAKLTAKGWDYHDGFWWPPGNPKNRKPNHGLQDAQKGTFAQGDAISPDSSGYDAALANYNELLALVSEGTRLYYGDVGLDQRTRAAIGDYASQYGISLSGDYAPVSKPNLPVLGLPPAMRGGVAGGVAGVAPAGPPSGKWAGDVSGSIGELHHHHHHKATVKWDARGRIGMELKTTTKTDKKLGQKARRIARSPG